MGRPSFLFGPRIEFVLIFLGLPMLGLWQSEFLKRWIIPQILLLTLLCMIVLWRDPSFDRRALFKFQVGRPQWTRIAVLLLAGGAALAGLAWFGGIDLFGFPRQHPWLWLAVLLLYPVVSALAQEVIFRVFFFHRYRALFTRPSHMIAASALVFALAHLELGNWVAPVLALLGGLLFAWTYHRTRSLLLVALEHGLWGDWLITLGLGPYFYGGHM